MVPVTFNKHLVTIIANPIKRKRLAGLMQYHKVVKEKDICPVLCYGADLRFQVMDQAE